MKISLLNIIKSSNIFASLDDVALKKVTEKFDKIFLHKNQILFHQDELSTGIYLLVTGKLAIILNMGSEKEKVVNIVEPGETVGELSALSHEPRSVSAKALKNSILLKLSKEAFAELCREYPSVIFETINTLVNRSRALLQVLSTETPSKNHIAIIPASKKTVLDSFYEQLVKLVENNPYVTVLSVLKIGERNTAAHITEQFIADIQSTTIIYLLEAHETHLEKLCFENVSMIYLVANSDADPHINHLVLEKVISNSVAKKIKPELILLHEQNSSVPRHTSRWLKLMHFGLLHHVRLYQEQDFHRIIRFITGQAIGLVLGGGGTRSWAHLGVIKALMEAGIPIDAIGGTSGGAVVAGYYALHETYEDPKGQLQKLSDVLRTAISFKNLTWPAISLFNGRAYTKSQKKIFGGARIENLWLPYFCLACNISNNTEVIHKNGYLWKAIRSSTAVPGIFPPVVIRGQIHLDGGIINNLPVDVMKKVIGPRGTIIAVELTNSKNGHEYNFPPILTFWQTMLAKLGFAHQDYKFPPFVDTFLKSLLAGSSAKQMENCLIADVLVSPNLSYVGLLTINKEQENEIFEVGYNTAVKVIKKWRRHNHKKQ